ncbi:hypothetical protein ACFVAJ_17200 [Agromyces sp. NPDC057679]|uniref:hypothetical protein n=1 Tax=Agromyces sp. NPDC057679 TaxID=3346207 RepID=UPI003670E88E
MPDPYKPTIDEILFELRTCATTDTNVMPVEGFDAAIADLRAQIEAAEREKVRPMPEMTERQAEAWPDAIAEAQRYVDTSTISESLTHWYWAVRWEDETRPGRGHAMTATWSDGEYHVEISMDVYGNPRVAVAEVDWLHNGSDEECGCAYCEAERHDDDDDDDDDDGSSRVVDTIAAAKILGDAGCPPTTQQLAAALGAAITREQSQ